MFVDIFMKKPQLILLFVLLFVFGCQQTTNTDNESCFNEGDGFDMSLLPHGKCCVGLQKLTIFQDDNCSIQLPDKYICSYCGDGICKSGENKCNCFVDCG